MKKSLFYKLFLSFMVLAHVTTIFPMKKCDLCDRTNSYNKKINADHLIKIHLQCPYCNIQPFDKTIILLKHVESNHPTAKIYCCPNCLLSSVRPYEIRKHIGLADRQGKQSCYEDLKFFFNNILPKVHHNYCFYCTRSFTTKKEIMNHFLHNHNMWLYDIQEIIDKAHSHNSIGIDIQSLKVNSYNNSNYTPPLTQTTTHNIAQEISDYYPCTSCTSIFTNAYAFLEHLPQCQPN